LNLPFKIDNAAAVASSDVAWRGLRRQNNSNLESAQSVFVALSTISTTSKWVWREACAIELRYESTRKFAKRKAEHLDNDDDDDDDDDDYDDDDDDVVVDDQIADSVDNDTSQLDEFESEALNKLSNLVILCALFLLS
jgi:hypothetical protein